MKNLTLTRNIAGWLPLVFKDEKIELSTDSQYDTDSVTIEHSIENGKRIIKITLH